MALVGKPALVADVGNVVPARSRAFGVLHAGDVEKADRRQAGVLLEGTDQRLLSQRESLRVRRGKAGWKDWKEMPAEPAGWLIRAFSLIHAMGKGSKQPVHGRRGHPLNNFPVIHKQRSVANHLNRKGKIRINIKHMITTRLPGNRVAAVWT